MIDRIKIKWSKINYSKIHHSTAIIEHQWLAGIVYSRWPKLFLSFKFSKILSFLFFIIIFKIWIEDKLIGIHSRWCHDGHWSVSFQIIPWRRVWDRIIFFSYKKWTGSSLDQRFYPLYWPDFLILLYYI